jgi:hypothetical protein
LLGINCVGYVRQVILQADGGNVPKRVMLSSMTLHALRAAVTTAFHLDMNSQLLFYICDVDEDIFSYVLHILADV